MEKATYPLQSIGLALNVLVGLDGQAMTTLHLAGKTIPPPIRSLAILDTGSDITGVSSRILASLSLTPVSWGTNQTASGNVVVNLFEISLSILNANENPDALCTEPRLLVSELTNEIQDVEVLIGMDLITRCRLVVDGPGNFFSLEF